jgi:hypothetical protein
VQHLAGGVGEKAAAVPGDSEGGVAEEVAVNGILSARVQARQKPPFNLRDRGVSSHVLGEMPLVTRYVIVVGVGSGVNR